MLYDFLVVPLLVPASMGLGTKLDANNGGVEDGSVVV
jgi:hypothetical protein